MTLRDKIWSGEVADLATLLRLARTEILGPRAATVPPERSVVSGKSVEEQQEAYEAEKTRLTMASIAMRADWELRHTRAKALAAEMAACAADIPAEYVKIWELAYAAAEQAKRQSQDAAIPWTFPPFQQWVEMTTRAEDMTRKWREARARQMADFEAWIVAITEGAKRDAEAEAE